MRFLRTIDNRIYGYDTKTNRWVGRPAIYTNKDGEPLNIKVEKFADNIKALIKQGDMITGLNGIPIGVDDKVLSLIDKVIVNELYTKQGYDYKLVWRKPSENKQ